MRSYILKGQATKDLSTAKPRNDTHSKQSSCMCVIREKNTNLSMARPPTDMNGEPSSYRCIVEGKEK